MVRLAALRDLVKSKCAIVSHRKGAQVCPGSQSQQRKAEGLNSFQRFGPTRMSRSQMRLATRQLVDQHDHGYLRPLAARVESSELKESSPERNHAVGVSRLFRSELADAANSCRIRLDETNLDPTKRLEQICHPTRYEHNLPSLAAGGLFWWFTKVPFRV